MSGPYELFEGAVRARAGKALIVGSRIYGKRPDRRALYPDAVGIDMESGPGVDIVADLEETLPDGMAGTFAHCDCVSVLEHSRRPWLIAANIERALIPGGTLFVTSPFVWRVHNYPGDYFRFTVPGIKALFPEIGWQAGGYAHEWLAPDDAKIPSRHINGHLYFARTESCAFGAKR